MKSLSGNNGDKFAEMQCLKMTCDALQIGLVLFILNKEWTEAVVYTGGGGGVHPYRRL